MAIPPRGAFGDTTRATPCILDPLRTVGTRDYRPEDSFRHIHWKATARAGGLQVRVFEPTTVDAARHLHQPRLAAAGLAGARFGRFRAAGQRGGVAGLDALGIRFAAGVYSNRLLVGSNRTLRVPPGSGPAQLAKVLESLAKLSPFTTVDFAKHLRAKTLAFPWGSTLVIVTATMDAGARRDAGVAARRRATARPRRHRGGRARRRFAA